MSVTKASSERYDWPGEGEMPVLRLCLTMGGDNAGLLPFPSAALALAPSGGTRAEGSHGPSNLFGPDEKLQTPLRLKSLTAPSFPPPVSTDVNGGRLFGQLSRAVTQKLKTITTAGLGLFGPWPEWFRRVSAPSPMDGLLPTPEPRPSDGLELGPDLGPDLASLERGPSLPLAKVFGWGSPPPETELDPFPEMAINGPQGPATAFLIPAGVLTARDVQKPVERVLGAFIEAYPKTRSATSLQPYFPKPTPEGRQNLGPRLELKLAGAIWVSGHRAAKDTPIAVTSGILMRQKEGGTGLGWLPSLSGSEAQPGLGPITSTIRPNDAGYFPAAITERPSRRPPNATSTTLGLGFSTLPSRLGIGLAASRRTRGPSP
jgi:hypothetical protein